MPGFTPGGMIATAAHAAHVGVRRSPKRRRSRRVRASRAAPKRRRTTKRAGSRSGGRKPKPGTKAWMAYIRGMKGKKRK